MATDQSTSHTTTLTIRERALHLADEAAREPNHHRRRELEQAALRAWHAARRLQKAVRS